jgi:hypothetical protein
MTQIVGLRIFAGDNFAMHLAADRKCSVKLCLHDLVAFTRNAQFRRTSCRMRAEFFCSTHFKWSLFGWCHTNMLVFVGVQRSAVACRASYTVDFSLARLLTALQACRRQLV